MPTSGPKGALQQNTYLAGTPVIRYRALMRGADVNSVIPATANAVPIGIATDNQQTAGRPVPVADRPGEEVLAEAGAAFAYDVLLAADANGRLITATTTQNVVAIARQTAGALSDLVNVEIAPRGMKAP